MAKLLFGLKSIKELKSIFLYQIEGIYLIKLLILDDHPVVLEGTKTLFNEVKEIEVETAITYREIIPKVKERFYDLYLLDINLPESNGVEIAEEIRKSDPESRIILYTG